jgi:hypothetical protein
MGKRYERSFTKWTDDEVELLKTMVSNGATVREEAKALRRTCGAIRAKFCELGLRQYLPPRLWFDIDDWPYSSIPNHDNVDDGGK